MEESKGKIKRVNKWNRLGSPKHHETGMRMMQKRKEIKKFRQEKLFVLGLLEQIMQKMWKKIHGRLEIVFHLLGKWA